MNLGNKIYELRTSKSMSQIELAEKLDVSRQSVSKWETDAAIPDLDKLIKLCDIFGVSLDELTGREQIREASSPSECAIQKSPSSSVPKILGCILIPIAVIGFIFLCFFARDIEDFYLPLPVLLSVFICGIFCLCLKNNIGYWCTFAAFAPISILSPHVIGFYPLLMICVTQIGFFAVMGVIANKLFDAKITSPTRNKTFVISVYWLICATLYLVLIFSRISWTTECILYSLIYISVALMLTYTIIYAKAHNKGAV